MKQERLKIFIDKIEELKIQHPSNIEPEYIYVYNGKWQGVIFTRPYIPSYIDDLDMLVACYSYKDTNTHYDLRRQIFIWLTDEYCENQLNLNGWIIKIGEETLYDSGSNLYYCNIISFIKNDSKFNIYIKGRSHFIFYNDPEITISTSIREYIGAIFKASQKQTIANIRKFFNCMYYDLDPNILRMEQYWGSKLIWEH